MALTLKLAPMEKLVINGAVIRNGSSYTKITVLNQSNVLRGNEIIQEDQATTPATRAQFVAQNMVLDPMRANDLLKIYKTLIADLKGVFLNKDVLESLSESLSCAEAGYYYKALAALRPVLKYEKLLFAHQRREQFSQNEELGGNATAA
jgi:flagellar protein FlbT